MAEHSALRNLSGVSMIRPTSIHLSGLSSDEKSMVFKSLSLQAEKESFNFAVEKVFTKVFINTFYASKSVVAYVLQKCLCVYDVYDKCKFSIQETKLKIS